MHGFEVFTPIRGLVDITDAGGGQGIAGVRSVARVSQPRLPHLGVLSGDYDALRKQITLWFVCGPPLGRKASCRYGSVVWSRTVTAHPGGLHWKLEPETTTVVLTQLSTRL